MHHFPFQSCKKIYICFVLVFFLFVFVFVFVFLFCVKPEMNNFSFKQLKVQNNYYRHPPHWSCSVTYSFTMMSRNIGKTWNHFKGPYADHILIPQGSTGSSTFFKYQMKAHIFLVANPKFQLQILCSFGDMIKNVKLIGIPVNNFLCIFIIASSPGVHSFFCLWRVNKKLP